MNPSRTQRYQCGAGKRAYTPEPKASGYAEATRQQAVALFVGEKNTAYVMTAVDCATRCILGVTVVWQRTEAA